MICLNQLDVPDIFQFYIPFILALFSLICSVLMLFTFVRFPRLRLNSGKMVLFIVFCEMNMSWLIILSLNYQTSLEKQEECFSSENPIILQNYQCDVLGEFFIFFQWCYIMMNCFLIHNLYWVLNNNKEESDKFSHRFKIYLLITLIFTLVVIGVASSNLENQVDVGFMGICSIKKDGSLQYVCLVFIILVFPFCIYVFMNSWRHYRQLMKNMKEVAEKTQVNSLENSRAKFETEHQKVYLFLNMSYVLLFVIDWLPIAILSFIAMGFLKYDYKNAFSEVWETICLILISGNGLFIFLIRIREPTIRRFYSKLLRRGKKKKIQKKCCLKTRLLDNALTKSRLNEPLVNEVESVQNHFIEPRNFEQNISLERGNLMPEDKNIAYLQIFYLLRIIILRQLGGRDLKFFCSCESPFGGDMTKARSEDVLQSGILGLASEDRIPWANHHYTKFDVELYELAKLSEEMNEEERRCLIPNNEGRENQNQVVTSLIYCKKVFDWVRNNKTKIELKSMVESLCPINNQCVIFKNAESGRSHHEFTTFDSKLVVVFISKDVKKYLLDGFLKEYHEHLYSKSFTFLPMFLGLFSFQFQRGASNKSYSILIYENPYSQYKCFKTKELFESPPNEILAIYYVQAEKTKKKTIYQCEDQMYRIEKSDLRLKSEEKSTLLNILYDDLAFLTKNSAFNYRFCLFFFKFEDKLLIESTLPGFNCDETLNSRKAKSLLGNQRFYLENKIGFCIGMMKNLFKFIEKKKKKRKDKMKFDVAINQEVSIYNPVNYGRFLYEQAQDL